MREPERHKNRQNLILTTMRRNAFTQLRRNANTSSRLKHTLVLVRHGESTWNQENKFTGTPDIFLLQYFILFIFVLGILKDGMTAHYQARDKVKQVSIRVFIISQLYIPSLKLT